MSGSRMVRVLKRDGSAEDFRSRKLALSIWRALSRSGREYTDAADLAAAIEMYLTHRQCQCISSAAVFEMTVKVLRRVLFFSAADAMEAHSRARSAGRKGLRLRHAMGQESAWDKSWLAKLACRSWELTPTTGRIIAGLVEAELLAIGPKRVDRGEVLDRMNACVAALGLADAVPVRQYALP